MSSSLKRAVQSFWDRKPCGSQHVDKPIGSRTFFEEYDAFRMKVHPYLADIIQPSKYLGLKVLEVGCGIGSDAARIASFGADVTAFDLSSVSVALTRQRFKEFGLDGDFVVGDAENLPFRNDSCDHVVSIGVLHHTPDTVGAVNELRRVLRPRGMAIVMLYSKDSFRYKILFRVLALVGKRPIDRLVAEYDGKDNPLGKVFSKREVKEMFSSFDQTNMRLYNFQSFDVARLFEVLSPLMARFVARILRRIPQPCFETISAVAGLDLYIFAVK